MKKIFLIIAYILTHVAYVLAQEDIVIQDADIVAGQTYDWTANNTYILDGYVFVEEGAVLNIAAGTVIKGMSTPTTADPASALIISRGGTINALGTSEAPIIFTTSLDDVNDPDDLLPEDRGLWGGLVVLGRAPGGFKNEAIEFNIEGIPTEGYGDKALYGGDDPEDNSGTIQYISIRHGGAAIAPDNEINGLTLGSVGSGTTIDHVEIFANADDGIEWFGGSVSVKYAVVGYCGDECFDYDQSWSGKGQYLFGFTASDAGDRGWEIDGSEAPSLNPKTIPVFSNVTMIGSGSMNTTLGGNDGFRMKSDGSGHFHNSIFTEFSGSFLRIDDDEGVTYQRFLDGGIAFHNNVLYNFGKGDNDLAEILDIRGQDASPVAQHITDNGNQLSDPQLRGISWAGDGQLDPRPAKGAAILSGGTDVGDSFFDQVSYRGAFGAENWAAGWTAFSAYGLFGDLDVSVPGADIVIKDADIVAGQTYDWTANNTYILDGYVFVEEGAVLNIAAGTVIKGMSTPTTADPASALIISQGGTINALGTSEAPIIFTTSLDDVNDPDDLLPEDRGLWGGLVVLGRAPGGFKNEAIEFNIEGIPTEGYGDKALYGGDDPEDNSGTIQYISIRHGGAAIAPDNEINGLTLGSVGSGTTIDHVEIFANADDGIEWFGGSVSVKYAVVGYCGDECFDYDQSWSGKGQYLFGFTASDAGDRGWEIDGSEAPSLNPKTIPVFSNVTMIGSGSMNTTLGGNDGFRMKSDGSGHFHNSIFTEFSGSFLRIDDDEGVTYQRFLDGGIAFHNNVLYNFGKGGNDLAEILDIRGQDASPVAQHITDNGNQLSDPQLRGISWAGDGQLDPRPAKGAAILSGGTDVGDSFFDQVSYRGAFGAENWAAGWTAFSAYGLFGDLDVSVPGADIVIKDADIVAGQTYDWTANNTYILDGYVFVEEGAVLNIAAGTVIKGMSTPTTADPASALIISQGGTINALGTSEAPIIFTTSLDDVNDPDDLLPEDRGLWGGLVVLGRAPGGFKNEAIEFNIEGIPTEGYGDKALYGGDDPEDNSGTIQYISIRHGGAAIAPDNEINGLTLGSVGSGTTIDHVEIFANADDGIEWFGGSVSVKYAVVGYCGDECFDYDQSWSGKGQYLFGFTASDAGDRGWEIDGSEAPSLNPKTIPVFSNVTMIGSGSMNTTLGGNDGFRMKSDGSGHFHNSIFTEFSGSFLRIDDDEGVTYQRFLDGGIAFHNNVLYNFGKGGNDLAEILDIRGQDASPVAQHFTDNGNQLSDPQLRGISWAGDGLLDPRPAKGARILVEGEKVEDPFFEEVAFIGAFGEENWAAGWTAFTEYGIFGDLDVTRIDYQEADNGLKLSVVNPAEDLGIIHLDLPGASPVMIHVFDMQGRQVLTYDLGWLNSGSNHLTYDAARLKPGMYILIADTEVGRVSNKVVRR